MYVPVRFWAGVWVGCRIRAAWVMRRRPAELRSWGVLVSDGVRREGEGVAYRVGREEDEFLREDGAPDYRCQLLCVSRYALRGCVEQSLRSRCLPGQ